jgi:hypothetical protein
VKFHKRSIPENPSLHSPNHGGCGERGLAAKKPTKPSLGFLGDIQKTSLKERRKRLRLFPYVIYL